MPNLRDYLDIRLASACDQWHSIIDRTPVTEGSRQVAFLPVETLICLAASLLVNHRKYGGSTAHRAVEPVPTLARLFRRPNSSVLAKMANLDGSRRNGAKHEVEVAARLLAEPGQLGAAYRILITAARSVGVGPAALPDFLGLAGNEDDLLLIGQRELDEADIVTAIRPAVEVWRESRTDLDERTTERLLMAAVRVGQHRFASEVLRNHGHRCVFCGLSVALPEKRAARMLIASHIKPWRECTHAERLDARNGLTACPTHDVAFDTGLMTVNGGLRIHLKPALAAAVQADPAARAAFGRPPLAEKLLLPDAAMPPDAKYLAWHRQHIFEEAAS
ncbi:HNH endonuclease [Micromonospora sp. NBC_01813]|uniref:HNH endonuclease n=1 Tax=Micromonospora sp. NBC_01813 TaxID=2975988 RepID=UPI002DD9CC04|nr:HNH endonuclease [Micromonospora sp. NBC_01813]WSA08143.1 HNH endonuclease [Micromonospora sp. NBC_01813]